MVFPNSGPQVFTQDSGSGGTPRRRANHRAGVAAGRVQANVNTGLMNAEQADTASPRDQHVQNRLGCTNSVAAPPATAR